MSKIIYVGNLPDDTTQDQLRDLFSKHGPVTEVRLKVDRDTGSPRGFGFVEMETGAESAITALDTHDLGGHSLNVRAARLRPGARQPSPRTPGRGKPPAGSA
jgi:RNA recognition motif-containing protein